MSADSTSHVVQSLLANMAISLIEHKRITTTLAKAKALRRYVEPLVTKAKDNSTHSRRVVFSYLQNKEAIKELFGTIAAKVGDRPGGSAWELAPDERARIFDDAATRGHGS